MDKFTTLQGIKRDNEKIISFISTAYDYSFELLYDTDLIDNIYNSDLQSITEYTLHRMLEEGLSEDEVFLNSGMCIAEKMEENEDFINVDLGYILKGLIISIQEED